MGLAYSSLNTMLHHWLIENKSFYQAVKSDPVLSMFYKNFIKDGGIGQTDIVKLHMGHTHQTMGIAEGGSFMTHDSSGAPVVVDSSTIDNRLLTSRISLTGTQKRAMEKAFDKVTGESLSNSTQEFVDAYKENLLRCVCGDGTGKIAYAYNTSSSTTVYVADSAGTALDDGSWVWQFLYPGMYLDIVTYATGANVTNGDNNKITAVDPVAGTITLTDAVDCSSAGTYIMRNYTILTTAGGALSGGAVGSKFTPEPNGIPGMIFSQNSHPSGGTVYYLGKNASTYPRWTSLPITVTSESLNVKTLDQAIYRVSGKPDFLLADPAVMSQFRYEAQAMKKLDVIDDASYGHKRSVYLTADGGQVVILSPRYLYGTGKVYVLNSNTFKSKGTIFEPKMIRGKLECLQTADIWFDDAISEFENICVQRNANTYITGLTAAW